MLRHLRVSPFWPSTCENASEAAGKRRAATTAGDVRACVLADMARTPEIIEDHPL